MENNGGFYAPLDYSAWLTWAALGLLVLIGAWLAYVFLSTRQRTESLPAAPAGPPLDPLDVKKDYLRRIDAVVTDVAAGRLSARVSHQELSRLIRSFVRDIAGIDAPRMTLAELQEQNIPAAALAVGSLYPVEFGPEPRDPECRDLEACDAVARAAETAREVVRKWN